MESTWRGRVPSAADLPVTTTVRQWPQRGGVMFVQAVPGAGLKPDFDPMCSQGRAA